MFWDFSYLCYMILYAIHNQRTKKNVQKLQWNNIFIASLQKDAQCEVKINPRPHVTSSLISLSINICRRNIEMWITGTNNWHKIYLFLRERPSSWGLIPILPPKKNTKTKMHPQGKWHTSGHEYNKKVAPKILQYYSKYLYYWRFFFLLILGVWHDT